VNKEEYVKCAVFLTTDNEIVYSTWSCL